MVLVCHVILQEHVIKGSCDFMSYIPSWYVITLPILVTISIVVVEIKRFEIVTTSCKTTCFKNYATLWERVS